VSVLLMVMLLDGQRLGNESLMTSSSELWEIRV
jgi:hypothetical protein